MGQYYKIVNLDKQQYIDPYKFGEGTKLMEFASSRQGSLCGLAILLSSGNGLGGGDLCIDDNDPLAHLVGSWAGDRIVVAGDYADDSDKYLSDIQIVRSHLLYGDEGTLSLYEFAEKNFEDISVDVLKVMLKDSYIKDDHINDTRYSLPEVIRKILKQGA
jgi:hypothetical protein